MFLINSDFHFIFGYRWMIDNFIHSLLFKFFCGRLSCFHSRFLFVRFFSVSSVCVFESSKKFWNTFFMSFFLLLTVFLHFTFSVNVCALNKLRVLTHSCFNSVTNILDFINIHFYRIFVDTYLYLVSVELIKQWLVFPLQCLEGS